MIKYKEQIIMYQHNHLQQQQWHWPRCASFHHQFYAGERKVLFFITLFGLIFQGSDGVKDVQLEGPRFARKGEDLMLRCSYNLERDSLYAVKWYRGSEEFYRFLPKESPPKQVFPISGVIVDVNKSDDHGVFLHNLTFETTGRFRCVISAEHTFQTLENAKDIEVVVIDYNSPKLFLDKMSYQPGERGLANCSIEKTFPVPNITWFINGKKVNSTWVTREVKLMEEENKRAGNGRNQHPALPISFSKTVFPNSSTDSTENTSFLSSGSSNSNSYTFPYTGATSKSALANSTVSSPKNIRNFHHIRIELNNSRNNDNDNDGKRKRLSSLISTLSFPVQSYSPIRIKCWGQLYDIYNETSSINIQPKAPILQHYPSYPNNNPTQTQSSSSSSSASSGNQRNRWSSLPDQFQTPNSTFLGNGATNLLKISRLSIATTLAAMMYMIIPITLFFTNELILYSS